jgi:hypothetical protein
MVGFDREESPNLRVLHILDLLVKSMVDFEVEFFSSFHKFDIFVFNVSMSFYKAQSLAQEACIELVCLSIRRIMIVVPFILYKGFSRRIP